MQPLVSYLFFAYNHEIFVEEALRSAFAQNHDSSEIIITDDCSTDSTAAVIERLIAEYKGNKPITFLKNTENLGIANVVNRAMAVARGEFFVLGAGDDVSIPERTEIIARAFQENEAAHCIFSNATVINECGETLRVHYPHPPAPKTIATYTSPYKGLLGATSAYRRSVFDQFGPLGPGVVFEDRVLPLRAAILGTVQYLDQPLVHYRRHGGNVWNGIVDQIDDRAEWQAYETQMTRRTIPILKTRLGDIAKGLELRPTLTVELTQLETVTRMSLKRLEAQIAVFDTSSPSRKVWVAARHILSGGAGGPRQSWAFVKKNFLPDVYFKALKKARRAREAKLTEASRALTA